MSSPDPQMQKEIDAVIYAEICRRGRRIAHFWFGALIIGVFAAGVVLFSDNPPMIKALFVLVAFVGIFGFLAFLSTKKGFWNRIVASGDWP